MNQLTGSFTLPGEAGYEQLTVKLAEKWGADVIRDSDGTLLSEELLDAGYDIYSTVCVIRGHNDWAKKHPEALQQTFLMSQPQIAVKKILTIDLMKGYFKEQFRINDSAEAMSYWQVYDRTQNILVKREKWSYNKEAGQVEIKDTIPWHKYTVNFMAYRIWEEISMYNHVTNGWKSEHLVPIDPMLEETRKYLVAWMENWCAEHQKTKVVRFTSLFYNFVWIWGNSSRNRNLFTDWASYDFTVSPEALRLFEKKYGYRLTAEDFINQGKLHVTHMPADRKKRDWMEFIHEFVVEFGKQLIDIVHRHDKLAYVFYDDSWVGMEPYAEDFKEFGFDGIIKCVFSGFEARLCAGVDVAVHELRLHPYLFPVGLGGALTFMEGGNPALDAKKYWASVRRALLREPVQRIGLGGYLHLTEDFPEFVDSITRIAEEFRKIKWLHEQCRPEEYQSKVAVLTYWGSLRSWTLSGHFHETYMHDLIHINESLSGLPMEVRFIDFDDIKNGVLSNVQVVINAGIMGDAWSGGDRWKDPEIIEALTQWVAEGGCFIGVNEPSAVRGMDTTFSMAHVLGVDLDLGEHVNHGKWEYTVDRSSDIIPSEYLPVGKEKLFITDEAVKVLADGSDGIAITWNKFGSGNGIYLSEFKVNSLSTSLLRRIILSGTQEDERKIITATNENVECSYFEKAKILAVINNSDSMQTTEIIAKQQKITINLSAYECKFLEMESTLPE